MAASIAEEMLASINTVPYKQIIPAVHSASGISEVMFPCTVLAKQYLLNVRRWVEGSYMNPNAMFEYFGLFSNEDSKQVRKNMLKYNGSAQEERLGELCYIKKFLDSTGHLRDQC